MPHLKPPIPSLSQAEFHALAEAGFIPLYRYAAICRERDWFVDPRVRAAA